ncbi:amidohydrolase [Dongia sedimenti]|uniref:Amidohydrolase n=1 Tax=Dongia sedimenti TaxID=3064282 RepID=A0ABU0YND8_9PROT|nr:amidohydrolase [Rhodospirillaceae bacterium R-7]
MQQQRNDSDAKSVAFDWVSENRRALSDWNQVIWHYAEPALREYKSAAWYVDRLSREGFKVEAGSGGMPTAFSATFENGASGRDGGPVIAAYAEYDAVPGNCQVAAARKGPRPGLSKYAAGHTDPHSALGIAALGGVLAAKAAMQRHNIKGTLRFFGEPAEKLRLSKPVHAAKGYYDGIDAAISFHPTYMLPLCNTVRWDTHCGAAYVCIYSFECVEPEYWGSADASSPIPASHIAARAPGANDALFTMFGLTKQLQASMLPFTTGWSLSEAILTAGQATADNLPAHVAQIQYIWRVPDLGMAEQVLRVLDNNAEAAAKAAHCQWRRIWVSRSRPGLANHAMAKLVYENLKRAGAPSWGGEAIASAQAIQRELGLEPMEKPYLEAIERLIEPEEAERLLRRNLPPSQVNSTSDDYTEYCWHAPTARFYIGRPMLKAPRGFHYPDWVLNALGGIPACIDPMIETAAKTIAGSICDLLTRPELLSAAKAEFTERTGGGVGGSNWISPQLPKDFRPPIDYRWPEYVTTSRGEEWWIPAAADE